MLTIRGRNLTTEYAACVPFADCPPPPGRLSDYHPSFYAESLPLPPRARRDPPQWNRLEWPVWGLSRFAELHLLLTDDDWFALSAEVGDTRKVDVLYDDTLGGSGTVQMRVADAVPIADTRAAVTGTPDGDSQVLWALTLTDERYAWADVVYTTAPAAAATWGALISDLVLEATGVSLSATDINTALTAAGTTQYANPTAVWGGDRFLGHNAAMLADAACAAVCSRLLVSPDGTIYFQTWEDARGENQTPVYDWPWSDLHGLGAKLPVPAGNLEVVEYGASGPTAVHTVPTGSTANRTVTVWLPHDADGRTRFAADYYEWHQRVRPHAAFAGFVAFPLSSYADTWVIDHDAGTSRLLTALTDYPWPLVGSGGGGSGSGGVLTLCLVKDAYGVITGIKMVRRGSDGTYVCEDVPDCPTC